MTITKKEIAALETLIRRDIAELHRRIVEVELRVGMQVPIADLQIRNKTIELRNTRHHMDRK